MHLRLASYEGEEDASCSEVVSESVDALTIDERSV